MCGLTGFARHPEGAKLEKVRDAFEQLLVRIGTRGRHATGVATIGVTHGRRVLKKAVDVGMFIRSQPWRDELNTIVADTRIGTYQNVLHQHNLYTHFTHFAISDELGIEKPHPEMFLSVVQRAGSIPAATLMVGNNYRADIEGAHACGLTTVWGCWNERYPAPHVPVAANDVATTVDELRTAIADWQGSPLFRR